MEDLQNMTVEELKALSEEQERRVKQSVDALLAMAVRNGSLREIAKWYRKSLELAGAPVPSKAYCMQVAKHMRSRLAEED